MRARKQRSAPNDCDFGTMCRKVEKEKEVRVEQKKTE